MTAFSEGEDVRASFARTMYNKIAPLKSEFDFIHERGVLSERRNQQDPEFSGYEITGSDGINKISLKVPFIRTE